MQAVFAVWQKYSFNFNIISSIGFSMDTVDITLAKWFVHGLKKKCVICEGCIVLVFRVRNLCCRKVMFLWWDLLATTEGEWCSHNVYRATTVLYIPYSTKHYILRDWVLWWIQHETSLTKLLLRKTSNQSNKMLVRPKFVWNNWTLILRMVASH